MVQLNYKMEKQKEHRTKIVTYWIIDPQDQKAQVVSLQIRRWAKLSAVVALLIAVCGLIATTFVWSRYGFSIWEKDSDEKNKNTNAILILHILGPVLTIAGVLCFIVACVLYEYRGKDNSTLTFDPGAQDTV